MRTINNIAPWYGSNRTLAPKVAEQLIGCEWVGVVFAGGMSELVHPEGIGARTVVVNDLHANVINLAQVIRDQPQELAQAAAGLPFHPETLEQAQYDADYARRTSAEDVLAARVVVDESQRHRGHRSRA